MKGDFKHIESQKHYTFNKQHIKIFFNSFISYYGTNKNYKLA